MTDPFFSIVEEVRVAGLRPRRLRVLTIAVRQLAWPIVRGWLYTLVRHINWENVQISSASEAARASLEDEVRHLRAECASLREQAHADRLRAAAGAQDGGADRHALAVVRHQLDTLQATLAQFTLDRAFFENDVRTEIMAIANIVDHYRDLTEEVLDGRRDQGRAAADEAPRRLTSDDPEDADLAEAGAR